jgi:S-adenosylmethionine hydrolase
MPRSGVITITTDFGHKGPFTSVMRGIIYTRFPEARIVDLAHDIPPQWPPEAGFWVSRSYRYFPPGTVHLAIVDPGLSTERDILLVAHDEHIFVAPDNGLLGRLLDDATAAEVFKLDPGSLPALGIANPSATFHGRDIYAPIAAELAAGRISPADIGATSSDWTPAWLDEPELQAGTVSGVVVTFDSFGNLITNIDVGLLAELENPVVSIAGHQLPLLDSYSRAKPGEYLALVNSFGVVEIARAEGNAAEGLGAERGAPVVVTT